VMPAGHGRLPAAAAAQHRGHQPMNKAFCSLTLA
jgi:hypothetical protein